MLNKSKQRIFVYGANHAGKLGAPQNEQTNFSFFELQPPNKCGGDDLILGGDNSLLLSHHDLYSMGYNGESLFLPLIFQQFFFNRQFTIVAFPQSSNFSFSFWNKICCPYPLFFSHGHFKWFTVCLWSKLRGLHGYWKDTWL